MTTVRESSGLQQRIERALRARREKAAALATALVMRGVMDNTPVEDGHAHEAWLQASREAASQLGQHGGAITRATADNERFASGDETATRAGLGTVSREARKTTVRLANELGFVRTLEYGGVIEPIAPGGRKEQKVIRPGQKGRLYGPRLPEGNGMVFWRDETGQPRFARARQVTAGHFAAHAVDTAANELKRMGAKVKKL